MNSLNFLYFALGGGFLLLVIFICIALIYLIRILRDFADASSSVRDTASKVNTHVGHIADKVDTFTDEVVNNFLKPFHMLHFVADRLKPFMEHFQEKMAEKEEEIEEEEKEEQSKKKKRRFGRK